MMLRKDTHHQQIACGRTALSRFTQDLQQKNTYSINVFESGIEANIIVNETSSLA